MGSSKSQQCLSLLHMGPPQRPVDSGNKAGPVDMPRSSTAKNYVALSVANFDRTNPWGSASAPASVGCSGCQRKNKSEALRLRIVDMRGRCRKLVAGT